MKNNWGTVVNIVVPIFIPFLYLILKRLLERKAKVSYYLGHVSAFTLRVTGDQVYTHSIVVFNSGNKTAKNVQIGHNYLPKDFTIFPTSKVGDEEKTSGGGGNIKFSTLVPKETVTISYLYYPPVTYQQVNSQVTHDDGLAKAIPVIILKKYPKWQLRVLAFLTLLGSVAFIYLIIWLIRIVFLSG